MASGGGVVSVVVVRSFLLGGSDGASGKHILSPSVRSTELHLSSVMQREARFVTGHQRVITFENFWIRFRYLRILLTIPFVASQMYKFSSKRTHHTNADETIRFASNSTLMTVSRYN